MEKYHDLLHSIRSSYPDKRNTNLVDSIEIKSKKIREVLFGVDYHIFDKTIYFYRDVYGKIITKKEALQIALDKPLHKNSWFDRPRNTIDEKFHFYKEVHVYPFMQPYLKRFGGKRWYVNLVKHKDNVSILEYGCGSAVLTEYLIEKYPHIKYTVADIPSVTLDFVNWKKKKYNYDYEILSIGQGKEGIPLQTNYDLIICQDVLEHTPNPTDIVYSFVEHLSQFGVLIIDFLKGPGGENLNEAFEQREDVKKILQNNLFPLKAIDDPSGVNGLYVKIPK